MPAYVLAAAVAASALGAVVLCALVVLYGFTPADEDTPAKATRRVFLTRGGHAVAAACFAATAILISVVLAQPVAPPLPAAAPPPDPRVAVLRDTLAGQESRLGETQARVRELEEALRQRVTEAPAPSRSRESASRPAPRVVSRPVETVRPMRSLDDAHRSEPAASPPSPRVAAPPPPAPPPVAAPVTTSPGPPPPAVEPVVASSGPASPPPPRKGFDLSKKLRDDWREIRRGVDSAGDDFRSAFDGLKRRLQGSY